MTLTFLTSPAPNSTGIVDLYGNNIGTGKWASISYSDPIIEGVNSSNLFIILAEKSLLAR